MLKSQFENAASAPTSGWKAPVTAPSAKGSKMKFMLMMNAPSGAGDEWDVKRWTMDELKAHVGFMTDFLGQLK